MIDLQKKYLTEIITILKQHVPDCEVRAFGSRVSNKAQKHSDLDLVVIGKEKLDYRRIEDLKDAFSESNLPIIVDVVDWFAISDEFKKIISAKYEVLLGAEQK